LERLSELRIKLEAEEWSSDKEKKRWTAEKRQLEGGENELKTKRDKWEEVLQHTLMPPSSAGNDFVTRR
jgi:hypothetical protein